ncbi:carboxylate-amine ligase [Rhodococcus sp. WAY2]|uniref:carboxylate-amine ligase n=1 Tax=Rhodococcus sp. WAY2 TaxID=2663121 RepID=UPI001357A8DC|nr:glutamate--cysteine ligase [Rhodococcus sp. WAY2]
MEVIPRQAESQTLRAAVLPASPADSAPCGASGAPPTIGVEEEFILVDSHTGVPLLSNAAVAAAGTALGIDLQLELSQCQIEAATPVCARISDLDRALCRTRSLAVAAAARSGTRLLAAGVPVLGPLPRAITDTPRYRRMADGFGALAEQVICGCHVHVCVPDRDTAVQVSNHLRPWLPTLLALTANSPIAANVDTGYASWRHILWARWPSAGPPPYFRSARHYDAAVATMLDCGSILDPAMVYWDVRLSAHLPTIEIRISDVPATVHETVLLAVLVRALVTTALSALDRGDLARPVGDDLLRAACWRAARDGLTGHGIDTAAQNVIPAPRLLALLLAHVRTALEDTGDYAGTRAAVAWVLAHGNGAVHQRRALRTGTLADVVRTVADRTADICPPGDAHWAAPDPASHPADAPESPARAGEWPVSPSTRRLSGDR